MVVGEETAFEKVLNFLIPIIVVIGGIYLLYKPLAKPFAGLGGFIKRMIKKARGEEEPQEYPLPGGQYVPLPANLDFE